VQKSLVTSATDHLTIAFSSAILARSCEAGRAVQKNGNETATGEFMLNSNLEAG
jgi:hypothetical protein